MRTRLSHFEFSVAAHAAVCQTKSLQYFFSYCRVSPASSWEKFAYVKTINQWREKRINSAFKGH
jgi:hypothetical protein